MENASKALLIAAGVFLSLLIISLLVVFYNEVSSYYTEKHNATKVEQLEKFNSAYLNYQSSEIRGNELISVINRIINYNNLEAREKGYERIIINVNLKGHADDLSYDGNATLFNNIINNSANDTEIKRVAELPISLTTSAKTSITGITDLKLQKLSSEIDTIVLDNPDNEEKVERAKKLTKILGYTITKNDNVDNIVDATLDYYQLTQFKRTMFKCTEVSVDTDTGRVNRMRFETVEDENGNLVME